MIHALQNPLLFNAGERSPQSSKPSASSTREQFSRVMQSAEVTIVTKEGDVVSFSAEQLNAAASAAHSAAGKYGSTANFTTAALSQSGIELTVEGDLSETELQDVARLFDQLTTIGKDFFEGRMADAMAGGLAIGDMGSLYSVDATFTHVSQVSTRLTENHFIPEIPTDEMIAFRQWWQPPESSSGGEPLITDIMQAQWQQIKDFLDNPASRELPAARPREEQQQNMDRPIEQMLDRITDIVASRPKITPFIPALANMAIDDSADRVSAFPGQTTTIGNAVKDQFSRGFHDWLLS